MSTAASADPATRAPTAASAAALRFPLFGAWWTLLSRHGAVLRMAWQQRDQLEGPKRTTDELAFLPAALSLQETPVHPAPRLAALTICALFVIALAWSYLSEIDVVAVAPGRIIVSQRTKTVQPLEAGVIKAILVKDGDAVKAGQLLIELDATTPQADERRIEQDRSAAASESLRVQALLGSLQNLAERTDVASPGLPTLALNHGPLHLDAPDLLAAESQLHSEWADISAKLAKLDAEQAHRHAEIATATQSIEKIQTSLPLVREREADIKTLSDQGFIAQHTGQDRMRERIELERDLATAQAKLNEAQAAARESEQTRLSYRTETLRTLRERLTQADLKLRQLGEEAAKTVQRTKLTRLTAPVDGTIQQLAVHTTGGVVTPAQSLMVIVPDEAEVIAEVTLENKDIGYVQVGQKTAIKLEAFPYTRYGTIDATVKNISADAVVDDKKGGVFPVQLSLMSTHIHADGKNIKISPGMNLTAEINTSQRRVLDYLVSPIKGLAKESLRER